jgi:hypothetical protein
MNELSPGARELVESHRRSRELPRADRDRMKRRLMLRVATLGATTAATGTAAGMSLASKIALLALGVTAVAGVGTLSLWALRGRAPADVASPTQASLPMSRPMSPPMSPPMARELVEPASVALSEGAVDPADGVPIDNSPSEHAKRRSKRAAVAAVKPDVAASPAAPSDPEPELRVLREAREDLRAGRNESAYRRLDEYGRQHHGGMLTQERNALSAIALCHWQPGAEAQARASEFLRISPNSPLAERVRLACTEHGR